MGIDRTSAYFHKSVGNLQPSSPQEQELAVVYAARNATGPDDLRVLLESLGLDGTARRMVERSA